MRKIRFLAALLATAMLSGCAVEPAAYRPEFSAVGVWWWDFALSEDARYLDFCAKNGVTEIYLCVDGFDDALAEFVRAAERRNIGVYALAGDYRYIEDAEPLYAYIERYRAYCAAYPDAALSGVHLDIEPHQHPEFEEQRGALLRQYAALVGAVCGDFSEILFDFDIPFWMDDVVETPKGKLPANKYVIETAARTFVMSYRDTAEKIAEVASDEIAYASDAEKPLFLSVETKSSEGDAVSFQEEGKAKMYAELGKLAEKYGDCGIAIHQIKTWFALRE